MKLNHKGESQINLRKNIMCWYPFEPNAKILTIENHLEKIEEGQYDYVILLGTFEHASELFAGENPEYQLLEYAKKQLKISGKIWMMMENKIGIKTYCERQPNKKMFNRKQIEELLKKCNLIHTKFYYPLPNYEAANVIFTDEFLPNQETLTRNITLHEKEDIVWQSENEIFLNLIEQDPNLFKIFTNTYLIECSQQAFPDNQIKFVSFSNMRKSKYAIQTVIQGDKVYKTAGKEQAKPHIENIKRNIQQLEKLGFYTIDSYEADRIVSQYQKEKSFDHFLMQQLQEGKKEEAMQWMLRFFEEIKEKLEPYQTSKNILDFYEIKYEKQQIEKLTFTQYGLWDLIFQNAFYIDGKFFFYDQEWLEEGVPIEYIFYRSIQYTPGLTKYLETDKIFSQLGIIKPHIDLFWQLDNKLQEKTRNNEIWTKHIQGQTVEKLQAQIEQEKQEREKVLEDCKILLNQKDARICFLEENMEKTVALLQQKEKEVVQKENEVRQKESEAKQKEDQIVQMENSVSWKVTKPLRMIRKKTLPK